MNRDEELIDRRVARQYRESCDEHAPAALGDAARRLAAHPGPARRATWPLALAATFVVALGAGLQLGAPGGGQPIPQTGDDTGRVTDAAVADIAAQSEARAEQARRSLALDNRRSTLDAAAPDASPFCTLPPQPDERREAWLQCIADLERAGRDDDALAERTRFMRYYTTAAPGPAEPDRRR